MLHNRQIHTYYFNTLFKITASFSCELLIEQLGLVTLLGLVLETVNGMLLVVREMEELLNTDNLDCNWTCTFSNTVLTGKHLNSCGLYLHNNIINT